MCAWYNNLEPSSIEGFNNLYAKPVACFNINIPTKKSFTELFGVIQQEGESTWAYLKRFNEEILNVKELLELVDSDALKSGVNEHAF
jgi:hypothetical protein